jgi:hypothetical protein
MSEQLHVYGAGCTWHGPISEAGKNHTIPCCPHCYCVLFETPEKDWQKAIDQFEKQNPGYRDFMNWCNKSKHCYRTLKDAITAYNNANDKNFHLS